MEQHLPVLSRREVAHTVTNIMQVQGSMGLGHWRWTGPNEVETCIQLLVIRHLAKISPVKRIDLADSFLMLVSLVLSELT